MFLINFLINRFFVLFISLFFVSFLYADPIQITGAGATFPYPIYLKWAESWHNSTQAELNYQPIGSGGGIRQAEMGTVDFGASDIPLDIQSLQEKKLFQFPAIVGGVVPVVHIDGILPGQLKLTGDMLAKIWLGKIKQWNDPAILSANKNLTLPNQPIIVVHRSDGSGTTFLFTNYLSKVNAEWKNKIGSSTAVAWPVGVGGKGNEGVAAYVKQIKGAIGYVEFAYAKQNKLSDILLQNRSGNFIAPNLQSFSDAAVHAKWQVENRFSQVLTDMPGENSWPITGASFILLKVPPNEPTKMRAVLSFFDWAWKNGSELAIQLDYVPLSESLIKQIHQAWYQIRDNKNQLIFSNDYFSK